MSFSFKQYALGVGAVLAAAGCSAPPCDPDTMDCPVDAGPGIEDFCNSPDEASSDPRCVITLCAGPNPDAGYYINPPDDAGQPDQDWYSVQLPSTLTARSLLHVTAGYSAPATAVDLAVTILRPDGGAVVRKIDDHGQAAPKPVDIIVPYDVPNDRVLLLIDDKGGRLPIVYDVRNPYTVSACVEENPDMNEPNDTAAMATPIALSGSPAMGSSVGTLATDNDVDFFSATTGALSGRNILYLHLTTPSQLLVPAPFRLSYTLFDPNMVPIAEGVTQTAYDQVDLATAKLIKLPGQYTVQVQGYKSDPSDPTTVPGDLTLQYTLTLEVLPDLDVTEPNDNLSEAHTQPLALGGTAQIVGRLSYVPDPEWIGFTVPNATPATMHVKLTVAATGGRFPALAGPKDRQLRILTPTPGVSLDDSLQKCLMDPTVCPRGYDPSDQTEGGLVDELCQDYVDAGAAQCLWAERNEDSLFPNLKNIEAIIPVRVGGPTTYWLVVGDDGNNYADDLDWTLDVSLTADPDELVHGDSMTESDNIMSTVNGNISYGIGRLTNHNPNMGDGIRGPADYDAIPTDSDKFTFALPGGMDTTWNLSWQVDHAMGSPVPAQLALDIEFCDAANLCKGLGGALVYSSDTLAPWYSMALTDRTVLYSDMDTGTTDTIALLPPACMCFESKWTKVNITVNATDRDVYAPMPYRLTQSVSAYPQLFTADGGSVSCPLEPIPDGGGGTGCALE